ncbi:MAG: hypothetical protein FJ399_16390 [Verrucomicrobia bacterium]|nr:hypothetical protein [Verrucomicrobiota bacterium]
MSTLLVARPPLKIAFGNAPAEVFDLGLPVLAGETVEAVFPPARAAGKGGAFSLFQAEGWLLGVASVPVTDGLEATTRRLYAEMFEVTRGRRCARIWNTVPAINECTESGVENYHVFCRGRSLAFERELGMGFKSFVPSASAVGSRTEELRVVFAATEAAMRHIENPLQVPAYDYPREYGSRAPSFARATVVTEGERLTVFISGTAAIRGHETFAPGDTRRQLECTLGNLRELSLACGLGPQFDAGPETTRHFRVYLRHAGDQPWVAMILEERLFAVGDRVTFLLADICRAQLNVEIEATLTPRR